jgi:hypothetical protein
VEREAALAILDQGMVGLDPAVRARMLWLRARILEDLGRREEAGRSLAEALVRPELLVAATRREARSLALELGIAPPRQAGELP